MPIAPQTQPRTDSLPIRIQPIEPQREPAQIKITEGDPFWLALLKGLGKTFLWILLATIAIGIGKWVYSKYVVSQNPKRGDDANAG